MCGCLYGHTAEWAKQFAHHSAVCSCWTYILQEERIREMEEFYSKFPLNINENQLSSSPSNNKGPSPKSVAKRLKTLFRRKRSRKYQLSGSDNQSTCFPNLDNLSCETGCIVRMNNAAKLRQTYSKQVSFCICNQ